jgi:hypothetical protein
MSNFKVGDHVVLQNLRIHPEFNGTETTVTAPCELREPRYGLTPLPREYLYEVDIHIEGYPPGLLVAESQLRHRNAQPERQSRSPYLSALEREPGQRIEGLQEVVTRDDSAAGTGPQLRLAVRVVPTTPSGAAPKHTETERPITPECWQSWLRDVDATTTFHEYASAFRGSLKISIELQQLLDDFGQQTQEAVFAVRRGVVEGVWLDLYHNYLAVVFTKASGDPADCVLINSLG